MSNDLTEMQRIDVIKVSTPELGVLYLIAERCFTKTICLDLDRTVQAEFRLMREINGARENRERA